MKTILSKLRGAPIMVWWGLLIVLTMLFDQLAKLIVVQTMELYESIVLIPRIFSFTYIHNYGAAWGIFKDARWVFIVATSVALVVLPIVLYKLRRVHTLFSLSLSLIIGGAAGNMIDRVFLGYVVDFLEFTFIDFPVFNIADVAIVVGTFMLAFYVIFLDKTLFVDKKKKTEGEDEANDGASDQDL